MGGRNGESPVGAVEESRSLIVLDRFAFGRSSDDFPDRPAEIDFEPLVAGDFEPAGVQAELMQDRGVDVGDVMAVFDGVEAQLVGRAVGDAPLDATAGHPDREAEGMMVAAVASLRARGAAKLGRPDHDRVVEQTTLLEVGQEPGDRLVDLGTLRGMVLPQAAVGVPGARASVGTVENLTNRTPRSTSRRADRHILPNGRVTS